MKLVDLHCDTAYRIHRDSERLSTNNQHISLQKVARYEKYAQFMAIFTSHKFTAEQAYVRFHEVFGYLSAVLNENKDRIVKITDGRELPAVWESGKHGAVITLEDARILSDDISRLEALYRKGIRSIVLMWSGESCIGGSHNTEVGLTDFGRLVTEKCFELGIIPDISHASAKTASEVIDIAGRFGKPIIASHSNSHSVYGHTRNLRDYHFEAIRDMGGVVGISLCRSHLAPGGKAGLDDIIRHIEHYLSLGGEDTIALGCDLDGTDLPEGFSDVADLIKIADIMSELGHSNDLIEKLFYRNAEKFIIENVR